MGRACIGGVYGRACLGAWNVGGPVSVGEEGFSMAERGLNCADEEFHWRSSSKIFENRCNQDGNSDVNCELLAFSDVQSYTHHKQMSRLRSIQNGHSLYVLLRRKARGTVLQCIRMACSQIH